MELSQVFENIAVASGSKSGSIPVLPLIDSLGLIANRRYFFLYPGVPFGLNGTVYRVSAELPVLAMMLKTTEAAVAGFPCLYRRGLWRF
jgi:hypothetical protein